jgi:hypothetical protein
MRSHDQLTAIASLDAILGAAEIDYWIFGGWGVDLCVGRVTREHDDVDVIAWRRDYDSIRAALTAGAWCHTPAPDDLLGTRYTHANGAELEFTFVVARDDGAVVIPVPNFEVVLSGEPLDHERHVLEAVSAKTLPLELLKASKATPREEAAAAAKDAADYAALAALA